MDKELKTFMTLVIVLIVGLVILVFGSKLSIKNAIFMFMALFVILALGFEFGKKK